MNPGTLAPGDIVHRLGKTYRVMRTVPKPTLRQKGYRHDVIVADEAWWEKAQKERTCDS